MEQEKKYELHIRCQESFPLTDWLISRGIESFVEGIIDDESLKKEWGERESYEDFEELFQGQTSFIVGGEREDMELLTRELLMVCPSAETSLQEVDPHLWMKMLEEQVHSVEIGPFWICPPWDLKPNGLIIEPGMGFGTGHHETTQLMLKMMEKCWIHLGNKPKILDLGTGSGILAIAAALKGGEVLAIDKDNDALDNAKKNAGLNKIETIKFQKGQLPELQLEESFSLILCNIMLHVLVESQSFFKAHSEDWLILSGILREQKEAMLKSLGAQWALREEMVQGEWLCLACQKI